MAKEGESHKQPTGETPKRESPEEPKIFISHDSRDAELAEAFARLLTNVSAGVLKSFRSSDKKGKQGIDFGVEWYPELMKQLEKASDVVCLLTSRSTDRPWILYEAGVAKGRLNTPVYGVALGIPLTRATTGPFAQFQNLEDDEESLTKLVMQLVERIPGSEPNHDAILMQVKIFKTQADEILTIAADAPGDAEDDAPANDAVAKMFEEIKVMFRDLPFHLAASAPPDIKSSRHRPSYRSFRFAVEELFRLSDTGGCNYGLIILFVASYLRDDYPWLYELGIEAYRATTTTRKARPKAVIREFQRALEFTTHGPLERALGPQDDKPRRILREAPAIVNSVLARLESSPQNPRPGK